MQAIIRTLLAALLVLAFATPGFAAERTVTLKVDNMTCASCPYLVRKSLERVPGVLDARVSFETGTATVTFDDGVASIDGLTRATGAAGYPSRPRSE